MKRRLLIALAAIIPLIFLAATFWAASRRPLLIGQHRNARTLLISPDGTRLLSRDQFGFHVWDTETPALLGTWRPPGAWMVPSSDGARVVVASSPVKSTPTDSMVTTELVGSVRDARSGAIICAFRDKWRHSKDLQDMLQDLRWSEDGREVVTLTNGAVRRFDARDGRLIQRVFYDARNGYTSWQLSPDAREIVATDREGAHFFSALTGKEIRFWKHPATATHNAPIGVRAFTPDGQWLWMGQRNGPNNDTAFFVRASDGHLAWSKLQITTVTYGFEICGFSGDGQLVLSLEDARIVARYCASGKEAWHLNVASIQTAAFAPDGQSVYSVDVVGNIRRWNAP